MDRQIKKDVVFVTFWLIVLKGQFFLSSVDTSNMSKTADKIFEMLYAIVERIREENVVQVVIDNAANYKAAGQLLIKKKRVCFGHHVLPIVLT